MTYEPKPIDMSHIALPSLVHDLSAMYELTKNVHDLWAQQRIAEGWQYGPARDDVKREHPCLVPFDELPISEQEYDYTLITNTLRTILALGYRIER
jgi:hypothetical protein